MSRYTLPLTLPLLFALACGDAGSASSDGSTGDESTSEGGSTGDTGVAARPNWHEDIAPFVAENCQGCHQAGGIAPFSMQDYAQTWPWATVMANEAEAREMPPWHALTTEECAPPLPYKHDAQLADEEIQLLRDWAELGAPEGDPALAAPLPAPPSLDLDSPNTVQTMASPLTIAAQGSTLDFFHCISIDPQHGDDVFLTGIQTIPGNRGIVHHVLIYTDETAASAAWSGGVKQDCGGGAGVSAPTQLIGAWVPGGLPMEPPPDVGVRLTAGARLIMNVHYHATGGGDAVDSGTGLALRWVTTPPEYISIFNLVGAPGDGDSLTGELLIPPGAAGHVEEYEWVVSAGGQAFPDSIEARVWAVAAHMHKVGVDLRAWLVDRDTGEETCLLHTPKWDFNWQRVYEFDGAVGQTVRVKAGDKLRVRCVYDNTLENPGVVEALAEVGGDAPIEVHQGEGTLDEMCLTAIGVAVKGL
ncbi:MAG: hypothetical protein H6713_15055 [Myxococcales bacterium]|nr:hypothetical protein [Myxococcales bacterium]MCB9751293.1 hypothetical protein [Myxococcales bacterium]